MKIFNVRESQTPDTVEIEARMETHEFRQLAGELDHLKVFAAKTIAEDASVTKTGKKDQFATWLLFPKKFRWQYRTDKYDFRQVKCGVFTNRERLYIVYEVPAKGFGISTQPPAKPHPVDPRDRLGAEISKLKEQLSKKE